MIWRTEHRRVRDPLSALAPEVCGYRRESSPRRARWRSFARDFSASSTRTKGGESRFTARRNESDLTGAARSDSDHKPCPHVGSRSRSTGSPASWGRLPGRSPCAAGRTRRTPGPADPPLWMRSSRIWLWRDCLTAEQCGYGSRGPCFVSMLMIRDTSSCARADSASHHDSNSSVYSTSKGMTGTFARSGPHRPRLFEARASGGAGTQAASSSADMRRMDQAGRWRDPELRLCVL